MLFDNIFTSSFWANGIEFIGALLIIYYLLVAIATLLRTRNIAMARLYVAHGAISGLDFKLAGTLLHTIALHTWRSILMFVAILALRILLKRVFTWEQTQLQHLIPVNLKRNSRSLLL